MSPTFAYLPLSFCNRGVLAKGVDKILALDAGRDLCFLEAQNTSMRHLGESCYPVMALYWSARPVVVDFQERSKHRCSNVQELVRMLGKHSRAT